MNRRSLRNNYYWTAYGFFDELETRIQIFAWSMKFSENLFRKEIIR